MPIWLKEKKNTISLEGWTNIDVILTLKMWLGIYGTKKRNSNLICSVADLLQDQSRLAD